MGHAAGPKCVAELRIALDCGRIVRYGAVRLAQPEICLATLHIAFRIFWIEADRLGEDTDRAFEVGLRDRAFTIVDQRSDLRIDLAQRLGGRACRLEHLG
jgi:hypothetical protein